MVLWAADKPYREGSKTMNNKPIPNSQSTTEVSSIVQERLRQARDSFNLAMIAIIFNLIFAGMLVLNKVPPKTVFVAGSLATRCIQLAKYTNDKLDKSLPKSK